MKILDLKLTITTNISELEQLLCETEDLSNQLRIKLQQISEFKLETKVLQS